MDFQKLLNDYGIKVNINLILDKWNESNRIYYNQTYLNKIVNKSIQENNDLFIISSLFDNLFYDKNETIKFFENLCIDRQKNKKIINILKGDNQEFNNIKNIDLNIEELILLEQEIYNISCLCNKKEIYENNRLKEIESMMDRDFNNIENLLKLKEYVKESILYII